MKRVLPSDRNDWTPEERQDFLNFYAGVLEREAVARSDRQPAFAKNLQSWADEARKEAGSIDLRSPQMELF
ncbi:hypothetical protein [Rhizobium azibense]|uniref:hypothetical protein n=1 Tax=Rhizobium azibense TaxID=1136135 RepID=UPI0010429E71|nr:hypothetical protein [Rhizobium azibense]